MATVYKTPGVFIEEISKLPPSVAQVETAIPAFIGYTAIANQFAPDDLHNKPKRIASLVEFELYYGVGASPNVLGVNIDSNNNFVSASVSNTFYLYDALQMFYSNGGGDCYIVSIGRNDKSTTIAVSDFTVGIATLEKEDAPTIILFPDAVALSDAHFASVQQAALLQSNSLQDRVGLFDVKQNDPLGVNFRNNIGINNLNYGAAYTPWLKVSLPKSVKYPDIQSVIKRAGISISLAALTTDLDILARIDAVEKAYADTDNVITNTNALFAPNGILSDGFAALVATFNTPGGNNDTNFGNIFDYVYDIATQVDEFVNAAAPNQLTLPDFLADVTAAIASDFDPAFADIAAINLEAESDIVGLGGAYAATVFANPVVTDASWPQAVAATASNNINQLNENDVRTAAVNLLQPLFDTVNAAYTGLIVFAAASYAKKMDESLALSFPIYKSILAGVANSMTLMPPSGAVAGVYAAVDRSRGVWKAPANMSLNNVIAPDTVFTAAQLDNLNVDTVAGKSINAIRFFTGKGTLVFGARTLAGNDNEWRYVSVRRFFNMVEESCKKATEPFVFEPNDANTWVKIQGMIENFLTTLWRQGALQGIKPEHAFYVAVGLGKTMTSLDILEGRLIVEIGMAVVRPAEFIILRFSHKLAES